MDEKDEDIVIECVSCGGVVRYKNEDEQPEQAKDRAGQQGWVLRPMRYWDEWRCPRCGA